MTTDIFDRLLALHAAFVEQCGHAPTYVYATQEALDKITDAIGDRARIEPAGEGYTLLGVPLHIMPVKVMGDIIFTSLPLHEDLT